MRPLEPFLILLTGTGKHSPIQFSCVVIFEPLKLIWQDVRCLESNNEEFVK